MQKRIGDFFLEQKAINQQQLQDILRHSQATGLKFGDAALDLGLLSREDMVRVFGRDYSVDFFYLDQRFYPEMNRKLFDGDFVLKHGVLPLGFKQQRSFFRAVKVLNLGMTNPSNQTAYKAAEALAREHAEFDRIKIYLILADQLLDVLRSHFDLDEVKILSKDPSEVEQTVQLFLESPS